MADVAEDLLTEQVWVPGARLSARLEHGARGYLGSE